MAYRKVDDNRLSGLISVLGLVAIFAGLVFSVLLPDIAFAGWMIMAIGAALIVTAAVLDYRRVGQAITGKRGIFSMGSTVMVSIFIGITVLVNGISISNHATIDLTNLSQFTLTTQTKDVLKKVTQPITITVFATSGDPYGQSIDNFLTAYQNETSLITVHNVDPDSSPDQARTAGVTSYPSVLFESNGLKRLIQPTEMFYQDQTTGQTQANLENPFTSAILEVTGTVQKKVYFLTGDGEESILSNYSDAAQGLITNLFKIDILNLQLTHQIPSDATAIVIAGPQKPMTPEETQLITDYLNNNGWLMIMVNPDTPAQYSQLFSKWGVTIHQGTLIDPSSYESQLGVATPLVPSIRNRLGLSDTYYPGATAITPISPAPTGVVVQPLFYSSPDSWLDTNYDPKVTPVKPKDALSGPLSIGVLIAGTTPTTQTQSSPNTVPTDITRIVIVGDSDFAANANYNNVDNGAEFVNCMELLTTGKQIINIDRKVLPFRRLVVTRSAANFINISSIALLPLLVLMAGAVIWWRRR